MTKIKETTTSHPTAFPRPVIAFTASMVLLTYVPTVEAGILRDFYDPVLYGDFAEGKGIFSQGNVNIPVYDKDGKLRGTVAKALDVRAVSDGLYLAIVGPQFGSSAQHVGYTGDQTFGVHSQFIYNDGTLFDGSLPTPKDNRNKPNYKPEVGAPFSAQWETRRAERNTFRDVFTKYLGTMYKEAISDNGMLDEYGRIDYKLVTYSKVIVDAQPYEILDNLDRVSGLIARVGAGSGYIAYPDWTKKDIQYGTPAGGLNEFSKYNAVFYDSFEGDKKSYSYTRFAGKFKETPQNIAMEVGICPGDSGSPLFWLDPQDNNYKLIGALSAGAYDDEKKPVFNMSADWIGANDWLRKRMAAYNGNTA